jgi:hypothetical protein
MSKSLSSKLGVGHDRISGTPEAGSRPSDAATARRRLLLSVPAAESAFCAVPLPPIASFFERNDAIERNSEVIAMTKDTTKQALNANWETARKAQLHR